MPPPELLRKNTSSEEQEIRAEVIIWMHRDHGSDCRVIHELTFGERRIDLAFVYAADIIGVEIKGPRDSIGDGRMSKQLREYSFWMPEVWLAIDKVWYEHEALKDYQYRGNLLVSGDGMIMPRNYTKGKPHRDEMCCSRLLDLLWCDEVRNVGNEHRLLSQGGRLSSKRALQVKGMLARMCTGQEIIKSVCGQLRQRPMHMVGQGSTEPIRPQGFLGDHPNRGVDTPGLF